MNENLIQTLVFGRKRPFRAHFNDVNNKMYIYRGRLRQRGGRLGLGDVFSMFQRHIFPRVLDAGKKFVERKATQLAPKIISTGLGVMSDLASKKNLKQSLKERGKTLIADALNSQDPPRKRQKLSDARTVRKAPPRSKIRLRKGNRATPIRPRDIFD